MAPPPQQQPLGMNLADLANQAIGETDTRLAGGRRAMDAYLASILSGQNAGYAADSERQGRMHQFDTSQKLLASQLAEQEMSQREHLLGARQAWESEQGALQRSFLADQGNRQFAFELGQAAAARDEDQYSLSDFGASEVNPYRGQALLSHSRDAYQQAGQAFRQPLTPDSASMIAATRIIDENGADPATVIARMRELFGGARNPQSDEQASLALAQLGYHP